MPALEDKLVQRATADVLNAIYEQDFIGFSYGFRPGKSAHNALDAVTVGVGRKKGAGFSTRTSASSSVRQAKPDASSG